MATSYQQLQQDASWTMPNPATDAYLNTRTHGHIYVNEYAPNYDERMEMTYRSLGRQYDWDMEKFRIGNKPADKGNKRRFFRNAFRFIKNPFGASFWRLRWFQLRGRPLKALFYAIFPFTFTMAYLQTIEDNRIVHFYKAMGDTINGYGYEDMMDQPNRTLVRYNFFLSFGMTFIQPRHIGVNPTYEFNYLKHKEALLNRGHHLTNFTGENINTQIHRKLYGKI